MSSINPTSNQPVVNPLPGDPTNSTSNSSSSQNSPNVHSITDSISISDNTGTLDTSNLYSTALSIVPPETSGSLSLIQFIAKCRTAENVAKQNQFQYDFAAAVQFKAFEINTILVCGDLQQYRAQLYSLASGVDLATGTASTAVSDYNAAIDAYQAAVNSTRPPVPTGDPSSPNMDQRTTTAMQNAITAYNSAVTQFQLGLITQVDMDAATATYNTAVTDYNTYVNARNASLAPAIAALQTATDAYNTAVGTVNSTITAFNAQSALGGGPVVAPFPTVPVPVSNAQQWPTVNGLPSTPPLLTAVSLPDAPADAQPFVVGGDDGLLPQVQAAFSNQYDNITSSLLKAILKKTEVDQETIDQIKEKRFNVASFNPLNDLKFIRSTAHTASNTGSSGNIGTGAGMATLAAGLSAPNLNGSLSFGLTQSLLLSATRTSQQEASLNINNIQNIQNVPFQLLLQSGLFGIPSATGLLGNAASKLIPDSKTANVAAAYGFAAQLVALGLSNAPKNVFAQLLEEKGLTPEQADALSNDLSSGFKLTAALYALASLGLAGGIPGLTGQVLGSSEGVEGLENLLKQATSKTFNDALNDTSTRLFLSAALSDRVATLLGVPKSSAEMIVSGALQGSIGKSPFLSDFEFRIDLKKGFEANGLTGDQAAALASQAVSFLNAENSLNLNAAISKEDIQNSIVQDDYFHQSAVTDAINQSLLNQDITTNRDLRDSIASELQAKGEPLLDAFNSANQALQQLNADTKSQTIINADVQNQQLVTDQLKQAILTSQQAVNDRNNSAINANSGSGGSVQNTGQTQPQNPQPVLNDAAVTQIATAVAKEISNQQRFANEAAYRDFVADQLQAEGLSTELARAAAFAVPLPSLPQSAANTPPLAQATPDNLLSQDALSNELHTHIVNHLKNEIGIADATRIADTVKNLISGENPNSVTRLVQDSVRDIKETGNKDAIREMNQLFLDFLKPNQDLSTLVENLNTTKTFLKLLGAPMYQTTNLPPELTHNPIGLQG